MPEKNIAAPEPPKPPTPANRAVKIAYVRNISKGPICEWPGGEKTIIHPGRVGLIEDRRLADLKPLTESATEADFKKQAAEDEAAKKPGRGLYK
jgi:hypothetical protein